MPNVSAELKVTNQPNCPSGQELCGFTEGMEVIIFDTSGNFDMFTITQVQDAAAHLQHRRPGSELPVRGWRLGHAGPAQYVLLVPAEQRSDVPGEETASQLRRYNGATTDVPLVDNVVGLTFEYFGDPNPPLQPKPPLGVANCLYDDAGSLQEPAGASRPTKARWPG